MVIEFLKSIFSTAHSTERSAACKEGIASHFSSSNEPCRYPPGSKEAEDWAAGQQIALDGDAW